MTTLARKFQYYVWAYAFRRSSVAGQERCLQNDTYQDILGKRNYTWVASCLLSATAHTECQEMVRHTRVCEDKEAGDLSLNTFTRLLSARCKIRASGKDIGKHSVVQKE